MNELEFVFPVASRHLPAAGGEQGEAVDGPRLASVLARHRPAAMRGDYLDRVAGLGFAPLTGYLRGFVDLVFEQGGKWYVVDYKSNRLGPRPADYAPARLQTAMEEHHYYLQYLLYIVAVDRYLTQRVRGYAYEPDFGGVYYLFLRGMAPGNRRGWGVFHDRPAAELIAELSALFDGAGPSR